MAQIQLNQIIYDFELLLGDSSGKSLNLSYDDITNLAIFSDLSRMKLGISFIFCDRQNFLTTSFYPDSSTVLQLRLATDVNRVKADALAVFVVDSIEIQNKDTGVSSYLITGTHIDFQKLEAQVNYSTYNMKEGSPKDAVEIVKELFSKLNLEYEKDEAVQNSNCIINYISNTQDELRDQIDKLLNIASSGGRGIYFLGYDFANSTFKLVSGTDIQSEGAKVLLVASGNSGTTLDEYTAIKTMEEVNTGYTGSSAHKFYDDRTISIYSHLDRKWSIKTHKFSDISEILKRQSLSTEILYVPPQWQQQKPLSKNQRQDVDDSEFGFALRSEMLLARCIRIITGGNLNFQTGEMVMLGSYNDNLLMKYGGMWLVTMITHRFVRSSFETELVLTKAYRNRKGVLNG